MPAYWNGVPIPRIREIDEPDVLQADEAATAGGVLRRDVVVYRPQWVLTTAPVPAAEAEALRAELRRTCYGAGLFSIDGSPEIRAYASPPRIRWVPGGYRVVELTITAQEGRTE